MQKALFAALSGASLLIGCTYFDTPEQAEGRCRQKGVGKVAAVQGANAEQRTEYLLSQYMAGCMAARGYSRNADGRWEKKS
jgi:hypothetical protein